VRKPLSLFACRRGRCRSQLRLGCVAWVSHGRPVRIPYFPTSHTNPFLCWQRLRASFLLRAFAAFDAGRGSSGGALAHRKPDPHPTSNERITTDSVEPMTAAMDHDAAPGDGAVFPARLAARGSRASNWS